LHDRSFSWFIAIPGCSFRLSISINLSCVCWIILNLSSCLFRSDNFSHGFTSSFSGIYGSGNLDFNNFLISFSLCKFSIRAGLSWCSESFGSNFFDGLSSFNSGIKSSNLSFLDLIGLSIISSSSNKCSFKGFSSDSNLSCFFSGLSSIRS
jgi:hypothetical protein